MRKLYLSLALFYVCTSCQSSSWQKEDDEQLLSVDIPFTQDDQTSPMLPNDEDPSSLIMYHYILSEYLALDGRIKESENLLKLTYNLDPNAFLGVKLLSAKIVLGKYDEAMDEAKKLVLLYPKSFEILLLYGSLLNKFSQFEDALEYVKKSLQYKTDFEPAYVQLISICKSLKKTDEAIKAAQKMTQIFPKSTNAWTQLTKLYIEIKDTKKALLPAKTALDINPGNSELSLMYAYVLELNGKTKESIALYDEIFSKDLTLEDMLTQTVALYKTFGKLESILDRLNKMAASIAKLSFGIEVQKAFILWELNEDQQALKTIEQIHKSYPESVQVLYLLGLAYERVEDDEKAVITYQQIHKDSQFYIPASYREIQILIKGKKLEQALVILKEISKSQFATFDVYVIASSIYADLKNYQEAIRFLDLGSEKFANSSKLLFLKGVYQEKNGDQEACISTMKQVIKLDPSHSSALNFLGYLFAEKGVKLDLAEKLIMKALMLKPNDGFYLDSLGWVYYKQGELDKAQEALEKAASLEPDEGVIFEHLAEVLLKKSDREKAVFYYQEALKRQNEEVDVERIQKRIVEITPTTKT